MKIARPFNQITDVTVTPSDDTIHFFLKATDAHGCQGLDTTVVVFDRTANKAPNVITPDGNGQNESFDLSGLMAGKDCKLTIMNRWGSEVFSQGAYLNNWQGYDNSGQPLPDGTYYYVLSCNYEVVATGPINILRNF